MQISFSVKTVHGHQVRFKFVKFNIAKVGKISIGKTGTFVRKRFKRVIGIFLEKKDSSKMTGGLTKNYSSKFDRK